MHLEIQCTLWVKNQYITLLPVSSPNASRFFSKNSLADLDIAVSSELDLYRFSFLIKIYFPDIIGSMQHIKLAIRQLLSALQTSGIPGVIVWQIIWLKCVDFVGHFQAHMPTRLMTI